MQDRLLAVDHEGVAGVVAALVAHDDVRVLGEDVYDLPLSLVSPLRSDNNHGRHSRSKSSFASAHRRMSCAEMIFGSVRNRSSTAGGISSSTWINEMARPPMRSRPSSSRAMLTLAS